MKLNTILVNNREEVVLTLPDMPVIFPVGTDFDLGSRGTATIVSHAPTVSSSWDEEKQQHRDTVQVAYYVRVFPLVTQRPTISNM